MMMRTIAFRIPRSSKRWMGTLTAAEAGIHAERLATESRTKGTKSTLDTILCHAGINPGKNAPLAPPLDLASTYTRPADGTYEASHSVYSRMDNPTRLELEKTVYALETHDLQAMRKMDRDEIESPTTYAFSSGMMAVSAVLLAHSSPITLITGISCYHGLLSVGLDVFSRHGVQVKQIDMLDPSNIESAIQDSDPNADIVVWIETPSNPMLDVIDIQATCDVVRRVSRKSTVVVDSTLAPPVLTQALQFGADLVMHSATKSLGGHSDALAGVVTASPATENGRRLAPLLKQTQIAVGGVASSFDSWLVLRGLRTLHIRSERMSQTALHCAKEFEQNPTIKAVHYPGLQSHPNHDVALRQMKNGFGGVLSIEMEDEVWATALAAALQTVQRATSLGGTETLIEHRASIEPEGRVVSPPGLLRISVGLEDPKDLLRDFEDAIQIAERVIHKSEQ